MSGHRIVSRLGLSAGALLVGTWMLALAPPASGQGAKSPGTSNPGDRPAAQRAQPPRSPVDRSNDLDFLFGALRAAPDADSARAVESRIMALWLASGSDTADLLMTRVKKAVDGKDIALGMQLLDAIVEIKPDYVEAWNRRATLHFMNKNYGEAVADLRQVLAREPRHFGALVGLGMILQEVGDEKFALAAFRRALEVHPYLPRISDLVQTLAEKVEGRPI